jgi:hypothetical protein
VCIPGGFGILGDYDAEGVDLSLTDVDVDPVPLRPVVVRPFLLDKTEFTVGRFRLLLLSGGVPATVTMPGAEDPAHNPFCTWLGRPADASHKAARCRRKRSGSTPRVGAASGAATRGGMKIRVAAR